MIERKSNRIRRAAAWLILLSPFIFPLVLWPSITAVFFAGAAMAGAFTFTVAWAWVWALAVVEED